MKALRILSSVILALGLVSSASYATTYTFRIYSPGLRSALSPFWTLCANENGTCAFSGVAPVRYGAGGTYLTLGFSGSANCDSSTFGSDPTPGVVKTCSYDANNVAHVDWNFCGYEGSTCSFSGTRQVRFGAMNTYAIKTVTGSTACSNSAFAGDPIPGVPKTCNYSTSTQ